MLCKSIKTHNIHAQLFVRIGGSSSAYSSPHHQSRYRNNYTSGSISGPSSLQHPGMVRKDLICITYVIHELIFIYISIWYIDKNFIFISLHQVRNMSNHEVWTLLMRYHWAHNSNFKTRLTKARLDIQEAHLQRKWERKSRQWLHHLRLQVSNTSSLLEVTLSLKVSFRTD